MKVAVYTIALNEEQFVARWYDSSKEADYHLICDTGSTDKTVDTALSLGIKVVTCKVKPFRFDDARNMSLFSLPEDIDYCVALDMDEVMQPGWRAELEKAFADGTDRPQYRFITDWDAEGKPAVEFDGFRIHRRHGVRWIYPVHEVPSTFDGTDVRKKYNFEIHHRPDKSKSRGQYLPMLIMAAKENPDARNLYYLGREYFYRQQFVECAKTLKEYLEKSVFKAEMAYAMRMLAKCEPEQAEEWLTKAIETFPCKESLLALANHYYMTEQWAECILVSKEALKVKQKPTEFLSEGWAWGHMADDLIAVCSWQLKDYKTAYKHGKIAAAMSPNDERLQKNLAFFKEKINANVRPVSGRSKK